MKDLNLIVWLSQLGMNVAFPLAGFVLLGVWLHNRFGWGQWTVWAGIVVGLITAIHGFHSSLKALSALARDKKDSETPPVSFNDHN